jgi:hypothetical protein
MSNEELRTAAYLMCIAPKRYTSDPDVIDNPVEMAQVKAEWATYFATMNAMLTKYPYSTEEKALMKKIEVRELS